MSLEMKVSKRLGSFRLDVELSHDSGVTAILGASGCGKSLTLQTIAGVITPDSGRIVLNDRVLFDSGQRINLPPQKRHIGYLFQNYALFPTMTVEANIACGVVKGTEKDEKKALVRQWIKNMQLDGLEKRKPAQLSGGQQQRTALARVLIGEPEILMLDEPFSALDSHLRDQLVTDLRTVLRSVGRDALLVTHSRDEAYELASTMAVMDRGKLIRTAPTHEMFADPRSRVAAILTGCKNVVPAQKAGETAMHIPSWGITLDTGKRIDGEPEAIGIRAHYYSPDITENSFPIEIVDELEEPFAWILKFRYQNQTKDAPPVWWRLPKDRDRTSCSKTCALGISPDDILLLYD